MSAAVSPVPRLTFFANDGSPLSGGTVTTYAAGTTTPKATYSNEGLSVAISNPIVLNAAGRPVASGTDPTEVNVYLLAASYKFVVKDSSGTTLYTADNIEAVSPNPVTTPIVLPFPVTVTGGVSGAIPYFSSTTTLAASTLLAAHGVVLGGGAGSAPTAAVMAATAIVVGGGSSADPAGDTNWTINSSHILNSATQPRCVAFNNTTQSLNNTTATVLALNAEDVDVGGMHDNVTNNSRITIPTGGDGYYMVHGAASFAANAAGERLALILKNGSVAVKQTGIWNAGASQPTTVEVLWEGTLVATDYVELQGYQASGGSLNAGNATRALSNTLAVTKIW